MKHLKVALCIICVCLLLAACKKECVHEYQSEITQKPSCAQAGEETFICALCKDTYTQEIPVLNHSYDLGKVEKEPTCLEEGLIKYVCTGCGAEKTERIEKVEHSLANPSVTKEPNCSEEGELSAVCTMCGISQVVEKIATNDDHAFTSQVVREATCTNLGEGIDICSRCQFSETYSIELKPHTYGNDEIVQNASCTETGTIKSVCTMCGDVVENTIAPKGHKWTGATCTAAGTCSVCGATGNKTDHNYVTTEDKEPSMSFAGYRVRVCETCGKRVARYYTGSCEYDLDAICSSVARYAEERGFNVSYESGGREDYVYKMGVWELERSGQGQEMLISGGKARIDNAYDNFAPTGAGIGAYTAHIRVFYTQTAALGGFFVVAISITS